MTEPPTPGRRRRCWNKRWPMSPPHPPPLGPRTSPPADPESPAAGQPNWKNRTIFTGDNLHVLRGMNSDSVNLIYLDLPFNSREQWNVPIGSGAVSDVDKAMHDQLRHDAPVLHDIILAGWAAAGAGMASCLMMMAVRLLEMKRVLRETGSIYLHCDDANSHYLKMVMDAIFGREMFQKEIIWKRTAGRSDAEKYGRVRDVILYYAGECRGFNKQLEPCDQKPLALVERMISASSNEGDIVLDPFCGCAAVAIAAEKQGREWVGIDQSEPAGELVELRPRKDVGFASAPAVHRTDIPRRTDLGKLPRYRMWKKTLFGEQEERCAGCGRPFPYPDLDLDHIAAIGKGGTDHIDNLQLLCRQCNNRKRDGEMSELIAMLIEGRIGQYR